MPADRRTIEVCADWRGLGGPVRMGLLHATRARGDEVFAFEYDAAWLAAHAHVLDPGLRLVRGPQYAPQDRPSFGVFLDSSPDRWGRVLLKRREALRARRERRAERPLLELDFLLGVFDGHRLGALRFRRPDEPFLDDDAELASPPWTSLRELEAASRALEGEGAESDPSLARWLQLLIAPGRSLGGARPKASVVDERGRLWIAKFPSERDERDVGAWERVAHALAARAGIDVPEARHKRFGSRHHTFLTRRFDRGDDGTRIHFASAMTMLERRDGDDGASYLELAATLIQHGRQTSKDLAQLWRRIVFSICISNVDDHLRNHGLLLARDGWTLAPAYDLNPVPGGTGLALNISETDNALDLGLARDVAAHFRVKARAAATILEEVTAAVRTWRAEARRLRLSRAEQDAIAPAFARAER